MKARASELIIFKDLEEGFTVTQLGLSGGHRKHSTGRYLGTTLLV